MRLGKLSVSPVQIVAPIAFVLQLVAGYGSLFVTGNRLFPRSLFDVSEKYETRLWPSLTTLPIAWAVIYLFQLLYVVRLFTSDERRKDVDLVFPITCALNVAWIVCFVYEKLAVSLAVFGVLWVVLATLWLRLHVFAPADRTLPNVSSLLAPFSLYLGWATFDLQLNVSSVIQFYRGSAFTLIDIVICTMVAVVVGWAALALAGDVVLCLGLLSGFAVVLYNAHALNDTELLFVTALAISSLGSAAVVRLATPFLQTDGRPKTRDAAPSSMPLEARFIEA